MAAALVWAGTGDAASLSSIQATVADAHQALEHKDFARAKDDYATLLADAPDHPAIQAGLARSLLGLGRDAEALELYGRVVEEGFGGGIAQDPAFIALAKSSGRGDLARRAEAQARPLIKARAVFQVPERDFVAEGLAYDPGTGRYFISSTNLRKVSVREPGGRVRDFIPTGDRGLLQVLGLKADPARGRLLVLTGADDNRYVQARPQDHNRTALFIYDLKSGRFRSAHWLGEPGDHLFNDLALAPDGSAYITDSTAGRIWRFRGGRLEPMTPPEALLYPNGIDLDPARGIIYVAEIRGVFRLDLASGKLEPLAHSAGVSTVSIDGLYRRRGWLIGVQSGVAPERVAAFKLSADGRAITAWRALDQVDPGLSAPTEGVVVGDELIFVADSHMARLGEDGHVSKGASDRPVTIMKVGLPLD